jgi:predicted HicB family RNase H-like nuclease
LEKNHLQVVNNQTALSGSQIHTSGSAGGQVISVFPIVFFYGSLLYYYPMKDAMEYNGYFGSVHYNDDDKVFYGKLEFICALVSYEGTDVVSLRTAFEEAVDDYLEFCKETGKQPEKPFKGSFNLRLDPELHKRLVSNAMNEGKTLNAFIKDILEKSTTEGQRAG